MIALAVIGNAFRRNLVQQRFQRIQVLGARHLRADPAVGRRNRRSANCSIRSGASLTSNVANAFAETKIPLLRAIHELGAAGLQHDRHIGHDVAHHARQLEAGFGRQAPRRAETPRPTPLPADIPDIASPVRDALFVIGAQQNLRPRAHAHQLVRHVESLADQPARLA